jgi:DNA-binding XRE family transcriptional regulator
MTLAGVDQKTQAKIIGIAKNTLRRAFKTELEESLHLANSQVVASLLRSAVKGNVAAQIFWCKTKLGWRERDAIQEAESLPPIPVKTRGAEPERPTLPDMRRAISAGSDSDEA